MQDSEASDGIVSNIANIDTTITATGMGSLRLASDTDVASAEVSLLLMSTN